jgi:hypothetical protein
MATHTLALSLTEFVLNLLGGAGNAGMTSAEIRQVSAEHEHHGSVSGALSRLHDSGAVALLMDKRGRSHIYVLPAFINGRPTLPRREVKKCCPICDQTLVCPTGH